MPLGLSEYLWLLGSGLCLLLLASCLCTYTSLSNHVFFFFFILLLGFLGAIPSSNQTSDDLLAPWGQREQVVNTKLTFLSPFKDIFWRGVCVLPLLTDRTGVDKIYHSTSQEVPKLQPSKWSYSCTPYSSNNNKTLNIITLINVFVFSPTCKFMGIYPGDMSAYAVFVLLPAQWVWTSPLQCARLHTRVVETLHQHLNHATPVISVPTLI